jgi:hypothetical protein
MNVVVRSQSKHHPSYSAAILPIANLTLHNNNVVKQIFTDVILERKDLDDGTRRNSSLSSTINNENNNQNYGIAGSPMREKQSAYHSSQISRSANAYTSNYLLNENMMSNHYFD